MSQSKRAIVWFRTDLRLQDNPALQAALDQGFEPLPLYIHAPEESAPWAIGAASCTWLHHSLQSLGQDLRTLGSDLILRQGSSETALMDLLEQSGATAVFCNRAYEPQARLRDQRIEQALSAREILFRSFNDRLFAEPDAIRTAAETPYRVFTPFWKKLRANLVPPALIAAPARLPAVPAELERLGLESLQLLPQQDWHARFWQFWRPGEAGAAELLESFIEGAVADYSRQRDLPDRIGTSKLSPHLHFGEISVWQIFRALANGAGTAQEKSGAEHFLRELGWREFSTYLLYHFPQTHCENLSPKFDRFDWQKPSPQDLRAWQRGMTGIPIVDAGMRELWQTGWMHNRVRMIVASFLCKNMRCHWLEGARWFWHTLLDADLANNTQGWQWTAGTGADAAPYFRIFNPVTQAKRFDPRAAYIKRWVPELADLPVPAVFSPWAYPGELARVGGNYPKSPLVDLASSRHAALAALKAC